MLGTVWRGLPWLFVLTVLAGCGRSPDRNADPRAMPGTDPDMTLRQVLDRLSLELPADAQRVRFRTRTAIGPSSLSVSFGLACDRVPAFLAANELTESRDANVSVAVYGARQDYGISTDGEARLYAAARPPGMDTMGATYVELGSGDCQVIGVAEKF
ncbi:MAG: hypothetical protein ABIS86_10955 [Streptosporangiaceae bacterium]